MGKYKNTVQKGSVRYIVFKEEGEWYAAGLEFNIVESGTTPQEAMMLLFEALEGYVEATKKSGTRPHVLNQKADQEYEKLWENREAEKNRKKIFTAGQLNLMKIPVAA